MRCLLAMLVACDAGTSPTVEVPRAPQVAIDAALPDAALATDAWADAWDIGADPTCPPSSRAELDTCLLAHSFCPHVVRDIEHSASKGDISLIEVAGGTCSEIYVLVHRGATVRAIKHVFHVDDRAIHTASFDLRRVTDTTVHGVRTTTWTYASEEVTRNDHVVDKNGDSTWDTTKGTYAYSCVWPAMGDPHCGS